ncbi:MAG TPA: glycosyltransferase family A protein, partial [Bacteroidia bacterium]|nr:glycosyltransferase family A protein [Bacteroidia bacterium]
MTPDLKFSVVIPAYNRESRIGNAIRSVLNQSYPDFEIIIVDDGSTDNTKTVVSGFTDPRVNYIFQENRERGAARNAGKKIAKGDYITFLDSDDEFLPDHLQTVHDFINANPGYDVYCTSYKIVSDEKTKLLTIPKDIRGKLVSENFLSCNGVFLQKRISDEYHFSEDREMSGLEDWELWLRIASTKKMIGNSDYTSQMNHHADRSVLQTDKNEIENRFDSFYKHVLLNEEVVAYYKTKLRSFRA